VVKKNGMKEIQWNRRLGILGGGQLGKMLALAGAPMHLDILAMDKDSSFPAAPYVKKFVQGDFNDYDDVLDFGRQVDVLTIEIEHVNTAALVRLREEGVVVHPDPDKLAIIQDKGLQKQFYLNNGLPAVPFRLYDNSSAIREAVAEGRQELPFVQKTRTAGYDGRGVAIIREETDLDHLLMGPSVVEPLMPIEKEISVIVARNEAGEVRVFPPVEMVFHPTANLVEFLLSPARIPDRIAREAEVLGIAAIEAFDLCGLLAVELFMDAAGRLLINEVAPRPHNSGHQTIEGNVTSQFQQHLRAVLNMPLGDPSVVRPSAMINLLGAPGHQGAVRYEGMEEVLSQSGAYVHLYGKTETRPYRKMGHLTVTAPTVEEVLQRAQSLEHTLQIVAETGVTT
jgi:5-(carboxyamino)imidazole ribonucleotide synthase